MVMARPRHPVDFVSERMYAVRDGSALVRIHDPAHHDGFARGVTHPVAVFASEAGEIVTCWPMSPCATYTDWNIAASKAFPNVRPGERPELFTITRRVTGELMKDAGVLNIACMQLRDLRAQFQQATGYR